jgi:phosphoglycerate dehydrogenase-like enzyme
VTGQARFIDLLKTSDVLVVAAPLTEETRGFVGPEAIGVMKPDSILVNIGRGEIVDEEALYNALRDRKIAAAGIDVWYNYPSGEATRGFTSPSVFPIHQLENVVLSPHRGGLCNESEELRMDALGRLIGRHIQGEAMPNQIDKELGY